MASPLVSATSASIHLSGIYNKTKHYNIVIHPGQSETTAQVTSGSGVKVRRVALNFSTSLEDLGKLFVTKKPHFRVVYHKHPQTGFEVQLLDHTSSRPVKITLCLEGRSKEDHPYKLVIDPSQKPLRIEGSLTLDGKERACSVHANNDLTRGKLRKAIVDLDRALMVSECAEGSTPYLFASLTNLEKTLDTNLNEVAAAVERCSLLSTTDQKNLPPPWKYHDHVIFFEEYRDELKFFLDDPSRLRILLAALPFYVQRMQKKDPLFNAENPFKGKRDEVVRRSLCEAYAYITALRSSQKTSGKGDIPAETFLRFSADVAFAMYIHKCKEVPWPTADKKILSQFGPLIEGLDFMLQECLVSSNGRWSFINSEYQAYFLTLAQREVLFNNAVKVLQEYQ